MDMWQDVNEEAAEKPSSLWIAFFADHEAKKIISAGVGRTEAEAVKMVKEQYPDVEKIGTVDIGIGYDNIDVLKDRFIGQLRYCGVPEAVMKESLKDFLLNLIKTILKVQKESKK